MLSPLRHIHSVLGRPTRSGRWPAATLGLIVVNVVVHVYQQLLAPSGRELLVRAAGAVPAEIWSLRDLVVPGLQPEALVPPPLTPVSSMFVHGGWLPSCWATCGSFGSSRTTWKRRWGAHATCCSMR